MTIKTYDGVALALRNYKNYPEGSLSPREVLLTIPNTGDMEQLATKLNSTITQAIYQHAEDYVKSMPPKKTGFKFSAVADLKVQPDDRAKRAAALTACVLQAIKTTPPTAVSS
jgi:hypothetical protein